jgi:hypothetical protein
MCRIALRPFRRRRCAPDLQPASARHERKTLLGTDPSGLLTARLVLAGTDRITSRLTFDLGPIAGAVPHDVLPALRLLPFYGVRDAFGLHLGRTRLVRFAAAESWPHDLRPLCQFVGSLDVPRSQDQSLPPVPHVGPDNGRGMRFASQRPSPWQGNGRSCRRTDSTWGFRPGQVWNILAATPDPGAL